MTLFEYCCFTIPSHCVFLQIVDELTSVDLSLPLYMFFMVLLLLPFMFVRNLKHMAPFSMLANFLMFGGIVVIIQHCVQSLPGVRTYPPAFGGWETLPLYFGIALYAFEGIGVVSERLLFPSFCFSEIHCYYTWWTQISWMYDLFSHISLAIVHEYIIICFMVYVVKCIHLFAFYHGLYTLKYD